MAIKIQTKTTQIPIEFDDKLTLYFDMSDENIEKLFKAQETFEKEVSKINNEDIESLKEMLRKAYTLFLGEEAFDKLYELSPSVVILTNYFWSIVEGLQEEIEKRAGQTKMQKVEKYLQHKNKRKK
mgnify:FL=1